MTARTAAPATALPRLDGRTLVTMLVAGALATAAFDLYGQALSPMFGFAALAPVPLANSTIQALFGAPYVPGANLLHYIAGLIAYPLGWMLIARPLAARLAPALPWWVAATAYGVALWVFALYVMAHLVAGLPAFLGFTGITWVALIGHVLFALVAAWVVERRGDSARPRPRRARAAPPRSAPSCPRPPASAARRVRAAASPHAPPNPSSGCAGPGTAASPRARSVRSSSGWPLGSPSCAPADR